MQKNIRKCEVNKFPRCKVNIQNAFGFLLPSNKQLKTEAKYFKTYSMKNLKKNSIAKTQSLSSLFDISKP